MSDFGLITHIFTITCSIQCHDHSSEWYHKLGHPSHKIFKDFVSHFNLELSTLVSSTFTCNDCLCNKSHKLSFSKSSLTSSQPLEIIFFLMYGYHPFYLMITSNTMLSLLIILPSTYGFTRLSKNLMCMTFVYASNLLSKSIFHAKLLHFTPTTEGIPSSSKFSLH